MGMLQISLAAVLWGTAGVVVRRLHESAGLGPIAIGFYRLLSAALLLLILSGPKLRQVVRGLRTPSPLSNGHRPGPRWWSSPRW